jgi:uncharacterized delta-60 repeat protein
MTAGEAAPPGHRLTDLAAPRRPVRAPVKLLSRGNADQTNEGDASMWPFSSRKARPRNSNRRRCSFQPRLEALERREVPTIAGSLDPAFGVGGQVLTNFGGFSLANATSTAIQSDGKIVVAGVAANSVNGDFAVARYNTDGSLDTTFNGTGKVLADFPYHYGFASSVALQSDGKIVVAGQFQSSANYNYDGVVIRYNSNGSLDTTFNGTGEVTTHFGSFNLDTGVALQSDGKIVVAGQTNQGGYMVRYNADGSQDTTFNAPLGQAMGGSLALQSDGKIVVAGTIATLVNGSYRFDFGVARINSDGSLDTTFNATGQKLIDFGGVESLANGLAIQPDGKIVVAGVDLLTNLGAVFAVARCNSDGSLDATFNGTGEVTTGFGFNADFGGYSDAAYGVAVQSDGRIVVAGQTININITAGTANQVFALAQYNPDGSLDTTFNDTGEVTTDFGGNSVASSLAIQADGKIVVAGYGANNDAGASDFAVARYLGGAMNITTLGAVGSQLNQIITTANLSGQPDQVTYQAGSQTDVNTMLAAVNALPAAGIPVAVTLDLEGGTYSTNGISVHPPNHVNLVVQNGTLDPSYPALTVSGGNVTVVNCTLITTGDAPTILVTGGSLTLSNDLVQESTDYSNAAIQITGGALNLAGSNTLNLNGAGQFVVSSGSSQVTAVDTTYQLNGATLPIGQIDNLIAQVAALPLNSGQRNSLTSTLQAAEQSLLRTNTTAAGNQVGAFLNQVQALVNSHRLGQLSADSLVSEVDDILAVLP